MLVSSEWYVEQALPKKAAGYQPSSSWSAPCELLIAVETEDYRHREMTHARTFLLLKHVSL